MTVLPELIKHSQTINLDNRHILYFMSVPKPMAINFDVKTAFKKYRFGFRD